MMARKPLRRPGRVPEKEAPEKEAREHADADHVLYHQLRRAGHRLHRLTEERGGQKRILALLRRRGPMTQRELTEILEVRSGSASEILSKIEAAGLIERRPSEEDQRTMDVVLTPAGEQAARAAEEETESRIRELFSALSEEEKEQLSSLLEKIEADWNGKFPRRPRPMRPGQEDVGR